MHRRAPADGERTCAEPDAAKAAISVFFHLYIDFTYSL
jgi:hypothetical protein